MKPYHTIVIPHGDILEGRLTMDIFAADLWEAYHNKGPDEYKDRETFFQRTYLTDGLKNLLNVIEKRIKGLGGDSTIQIQTPFGGGKTHSLIALMHKAKEWKSKCVVILGTNLSDNETLWGILEKQLTGKNELLTGFTAPGKEKLKNLLVAHQPLVILMDEVLEYITKAAGRSIGESTLAAQTMAFMQELTETISILEKASLVVTLPSSLMEHYDQSTERLFTQLQKVVGRVEKIYTPVSESEIAKVIRQRLFSSINKEKVKRVVKEFIDYTQKENILPSGLEPTEYRDRFIDSYPFTPEVIDVLYHRWGSFPNFQRTRGVLRLLSLVISTTKDKNISYITLADFDLNQQEIRQELLKFIGAEYNSVIAQDITDADCGSKKVDMNLGDSYRGFKLATRASTTIFMYSFSGGAERGATLAEIKRSATTLNNPSSVVAEAVEQLKGKLFYFQIQSDKYFFSNRPNLNRIVLTKMENIKDEDILELEKELLKKNIKAGIFKVFIWEEESSNIPDTEELKLVILAGEKKDVIESIIKGKGASSRVNCNTVFFLFPKESERSSFSTQLKRYKAYLSIDNDSTLSISAEQRKDIKDKIKKEESELTDAVRRYYRYIAIPAKDEYKTSDLGIPTYGEKKYIDQEIYEKLRSEGEILENLAPIVIKERYLKDKDFVLTQQILTSCYRTPGEPRIKDRTVLEKGISDGVRNGLFGLGELENEKSVCRYFKENPEIGFSEKEIIINEQICKELSIKEQFSVAEKSSAYVATSVEQKGVSENIEQKSEDVSLQEYREEVGLSFEIPKGKVSDISRMLNYLQTQFDSLCINIKATNGKISRQDCENKILETLRQLGILNIKLE